MHIGRSWQGTRLEDACPCPKAPCGLVIAEEAVDECAEHPWHRLKTMRQGHADDRCPA